MVMKKTAPVASRRSAPKAKVTRARAPKKDEYDMEHATPVELVIEALNPADAVPVKKTKKPAAKTVAAKAESKPVAKSAAKPEAKSTAKPAAKAVAKPAAKFAVEPVAKEASKPTAKTAAKPAAKAVKKPAARKAKVEEEEVALNPVAMKAAVSKLLKAVAAQDEDAEDDFEDDDEEIESEQEGEEPETHEEDSEEAEGDDDDREPAERPTPKLERLQKILSHAGIASRRHAEELILGGNVQVNGQVVDTLGAKADPEHDHIRVNGKLLQGAERARYFMLNKPKGYVTTVSDPEGRPTVMHFFDKMGERLYPVGRLDYLSEGLLLITNDGDLANKLTHARYGVEKVYLVKVSGQPTEEAIEELRTGIAIERTQPGSDKVQVAPARIRQIRAGDNPWFEVVLVEGRNRELRKMFSAIGHFVEKIRRVGYGPLILDIDSGEIRELDSGEVDALRATSEGKQKQNKFNFSKLLPREAGRSVELAKEYGSARKARFAASNAEGGERRPYRAGGDGERKPFRAAGREGRSFESGRSGFGREGAKPRFDREGGAGRSFGGDRPQGTRPSAGRPSFDRKPFGDKPRFDRAGGAGRSFGGDRPQGARPSTGRPSFDRKPFGAKPRFDRAGGAGRSFGGDRPQGARPSAGRPSFDRKPFGDKPRFDRAGAPGRSFGSDRPQGSRPSTGRPSFDRKPFGDKPRFDRAGGPGRSFGGDRPQGSRPSTGRPSFDRKPFGDKPRFDRAGGAGRSFGGPRAEGGSTGSFEKKPFEKKSFGGDRKPGFGSKPRPGGFKGGAKPGFSRGPRPGGSRPGSRPGGRPAGGPGGRPGGRPTGGKRS